MASWFILFEKLKDFFLEVLALLEIAFAVVVVLGAFHVGHGLTDWRCWLVGFLVRRFNFGHDIVNVGVEADLMVIAGLPVGEVVVESLVVDTDGLGRLGYGCKGLPSGFKLDVNFLAFWPTFCLGLRGRHCWNNLLFGLLPSFFQSGQS